MASRTSTDPLEILLEMGVDLDNLSEEEDYLSALMEAIATIEFQTKGKGDERSAALREEVIKIRKGKRKPQAKTTKISADMLRPSPKLMGAANKINPSKLLPSSQEENTKQPEQDSIIKILTDISESVKSILYSLKASNNISKNLAVNSARGKGKGSKILFLSILLFSITESAKSQDYINPLDFRLQLSGTFGELRSNHFHAGIDLKTKGVEGQKVYLSLIHI